MINIVKILLFVLILASPYLAKSKEKPFLPRTFEAKFKQVYKSSLRGKMRKSECKMDYQYPERIRFITEKPDKITYVSNPFKTWYYVAPDFEGVPGELTVTPTSKNNPYSKFFDSLKKGMKSNDLYSVKTSKEGTILTFKEKASKKVGVKEALLKFKGAKKFENVKAIVLTYLRGKKVTLEFDSIKSGMKFPSHHFTFVAPKNTRVNNSTN